MRRFLPLLQKAAILDIDGVFIRGSTNIAGSGAALQKLNANKIPWVMLTNGSGPEAKKAESVSKIIGCEVPAERVIVSHTPLRDMSDMKDDRILISGTKTGVEAIRSYGFTNAVWSEDHMHHYPKDTPHKWRAGRKPEIDRTSSLSRPCSDTPFRAVFVVGEPMDWHSELQIITDALLTDPETNERNATQNVPLYWFNDDIVFAGDHPHPRLAGGAFFECINAVHKAIIGGLDDHDDLDVIRFGKPHASQYDFALKELRKQNPNISEVYCVGDNLLSDIRGANIMDCCSQVDFKSVLVLSGVTSLDKSKEAEDECVPKMVFRDIASFVDNLCDHTITVITGPNCPLCDDGIASLEEALHDLNLPSLQVEVKCCSELQEPEASEYKYRVPVFLLDGEELAYGKVSTGSLKYEIKRNL